MRKNIITIVLLVSALVLMTANLSFAENNITVLLNGRNIEFDQPPIIKDDRTLVPMRAIFESMGMNVEWDDVSRRIDAGNKEISISMTVDNPVYKISKENSTATSTMEVPPTIINGRTLVPVRVIAESTGYNVEWDANNQRVIITSPSGSAAPADTASLTTDPMPESTPSAVHERYHESILYTLPHNTSMLSYVFDEDETVYFLQREYGKTYDSPSTLSVQALNIKTGECSLVCDDVEDITYYAEEYMTPEQRLLGYSEEESLLFKNMPDPGTYSRYVPEQLVYDRENKHLIINGYFRERSYVNRYGDTVKSTERHYYYAFDLSDNKKMFARESKDVILGIVNGNILVTGTYNNVSDSTYKGTNLLTIEPYLFNELNYNKYSNATIYQQGNNTYKLSINNDHNNSVFTVTIPDVNETEDIYTNKYKDRMREEDRDTCNFRISKLDIETGDETELLKVDACLSYGINNGIVYIYYLDEKNILRFDKIPLETMRRELLDISIEYSNCDWPDLYVEESSVINPNYISGTQLIPVSDEEIIGFQSLDRIFRRIQKY